MPDSPTNDPRSLAWMSERAVSALNAVRANQAVQAKELLARVKKPPARHPAAGGQPEEYCAAEIASPQIPDTGKSENITRPVEPEQSATAEQPVAIPEPAPPLEQGKEPPPASGMQPHIAPPAPAVSLRNRLPLRPAMLAGMLTVAGLLVYWSWPDTDDAADPETVKNALMVGDDTSVVEVPQPEMISVVAGKPAIPSATPETGEAWTPATVPDWPEPETVTGQPAVATVASEPVSDTAQQNATTTARPATAATLANSPPTGKTAADTTAKPAAPVQPATTAKPAVPVTPATTTRPPAPQPRYQAPAYGQYPQQPGWQQPYYRQAYPRYPSR